MHHDPKTHDALCPMSWPTGYADPPKVCACHVIARARADEREQAAQRVAQLPHWEDGWPENVVINRQPAIDAAEGEE